MAYGMRRRATSRRCANPNPIPAYSVWLEREGGTLHAGPSPTPSARDPLRASPEDLGGLRGDRRA
eukprot:1743334-Prymnesium_polylepis.3